MTRRDHDAGRGGQVPDSEREHRGRLARRPGGPAARGGGGGAGGGGPPTRGGAAGRAAAPSRWWGRAGERRAGGFVTSETPTPGAPGCRAALVWGGGDLPPLSAPAALSILI